MNRVLIKILIVVFVAAGMASCKSNKKSKPSYSKNSTKSTTSASKKKADSIVKSASKYLGTKYKYGGMSKSGMDCSGLMCTSFSEHGVQLPRTSSAQSTAGKRVYIGELQPGDLIFFATGSNKSKITHVGLVCERVAKDDIKFIHATTKRGVCYDLLSQPYYKSRYIKAVRPLK